MEERMQVRPRQRRAKGAFPEPSPAPDGTAVVWHGPYSEPMPVSGMTVGEIREQFRDRFDIDPRSQGYIGGTDVQDDYVVRAGEVLMFAHQNGEKGTGGGA
ncbi:MAG: hypothetical protein ACE5F1_02290 [Planctomycetota bacterium]